MQRHDLDQTVVVAGSHRLAGYLRAQVSGLEGSSYPLFRNADVIVVGSDPECSWRVEDPKMAARHLRIVWDGVLLFVEPIAAEPEVLVDHQPLAAGRALVQPYQTVSVGATTIMLEVVYDSADGTVVVPMDPGDKTVVDKTVILPAPEVTERISRSTRLAAVGRTPPGRRPRARYQPPRNAASVADVTQSWPLADAERPVADVFGRINRTNLRWLARRWRKLRWKPWIAAMLAVLLLLGAWATRQSLRPKPAAAVRARAAPRPLRTPSAIDATPAETPVTVPESPGLMLRRAVDSYRSGRFHEARAAFDTLAAQSGDPAARLAVWILDHRDVREKP